MRRNVMKSSGFEGMKIKRRWNEDLTMFEAKCMIAEREFIILEQSAKISKNEPLKYYLNFLIGLFFFVVSVLWIVHIYLFIIVRVFGRPVNPFFN